MGGRAGRRVRAAKRAGGARVLVVEDENIIARDIAQRLEALGHEVVGTEATGAGAVAAAGRSAPDIVLMDIVLDGPMDGIEAAGLIAELYGLPVVLLTAFGDRDTLERARACGPQGYILKPFDDRELEITLEIALERHSIERAVRDSRERFRMLAEASFEGVLVYRGGTVLDANGRLANLLGCEPRELPGRRLFDLVDPSCHDGIGKRILAGDDSAFELRMRRWDGTTFPAEAVARPVGGGVPGTRVMVVRDLTLQKEAERALRRRATRELYGFVVSALPLVTSGAHQEVREDLIKTFSDRFDAFFRPAFEREAVDGDEPRPPLERFLAWSAALFAGFGMDPAVSSGDGFGALELRACPWRECSASNPVFCLLCRAMAARGYAWAVPGGSVGLKGTIAAGRDRCRLEFWPHPGRRGV